MSPVPEEIQCSDDRATLSLPETLGPYQLFEIIGAGGVGVVCRARHLDTGHLVAVKMAKTAREGHLASIRREIQVLKEIRFPGVVRILDGGISARRPWYAMELLEGDTLASRFPGVSHARRHERSNSYMRLPDASTLDSGTGRLRSPPSDAQPSRFAVRLDGAEDDAKSLAEVLTILRRVCVPLAFLHGEGIVHRDLKPTNIFIRPGNEPVLVDFGLAWRSFRSDGRENLEGVASREGTVGYMSPEQISGDIVDARADLYALGCLLYEAVTGVPPFIGSRNEDVLEQHLFAQPKPPSAITPDISPELEVLILRLLAKRPRDRLGHATDVEEALSRLGAEGWSNAEFESKPRSYLYRPTLAGRDSVVAVLDTHMDAARAGNGAFVVVGGESGIGKTSLVAEIAKRAHSKKMWVITGECQRMFITDEMSGGKGAPLQPFSRFFQALSDRCTAQGAAVTERLLGGRAKILGRCEPQLLSIPSATSHPDVPDLPAQAVRRRLLEALAETLASASEDQALILILDDLQWADELSLTFLSTLPDEFFEGKRLLVLGTYRSDEVDVELRGLLERPYVQNLQLRGLDRAGVSAAAAGMLALDPPPPAIVGFLAEQSGGNPFFVTEFLRTAVSDGLLTRDSSGRWHLLENAKGLSTLELPRSIRDLILRRFEGLSPQARELVGVAAVLGREMSAQLLLRVAASSRADPLTEADFLATTAELLRRQIFDDAPDDSFRFLHDRLRETAYGILPAARKELLHLKSAQAIEERFASTPDLPRVLPALAHHYSESSDRAKAIEYLERAGGQARASFNNTEAAAFFDHALRVAAELGPDISDFRKARWERQLGEAFLGLGRLVESQLHLHRAVALLGFPIPESRGRLLLGLFRQVARQATHRFRSNDATRGRHPDVARLREAARAYDLLMPVSYYLTGELPRILYATLCNLNLAEQAGPCPELALAYANAQATSGLVPMHAMARMYGRNAKNVLPAVDDEAIRTWVRTMESVYLIGIADWTEARRLALDVQRTAAELKYHRRWEEATGILATIDFLSGSAEQALDGFMAQYQSSQRGDVQVQIWALAGLAQTLARIGRADPAVEYGRRAVGLLAHKQGRPEQIFARAALARALLEEGRSSVAVAAADEALAVIRQGAPVAFYCINAYAMVAEVYLVVAETCPTERALVEACRLGSHRALHELKKCAKVFAASRPSLEICRGRRHWLDGRRDAARKCWARARQDARALNMSYEISAAELLLERHAS